MATTSAEATDKLKSAGTDLLKAAGEKAMKAASDRVGGLTDRLEDIADGGPLTKAVMKGGEAKLQGDNPVMGAVKGMAGGVKDSIKDKLPGGKGKGNKTPKATKSTNIIESIDVGVPIKVAYNQWTTFGEFPSFMKKVEKVEAVDDNKLSWKAQIVWSHRTWEATILEQKPDEKIVWRSQGQKGHVDGAVTFHEVTPTLTRILLVLEYYPQGLFEKTGNIWRAQGRRARAEFKHFRRHVMTRTILSPEELEGWRGVIEDGEVVKTHEEALEEEEREQQESEDQSEEQSEEGYDEDEAPEDEYDEGEEEGDEEEPEDEYDEEADEDSEEYEDGADSEEEPEDEYEDSDGEEPEDEYEEDEGEDEEPEDEYDEDEDYEEEPRRRRAS